MSVFYRSININCMPSFRPHHFHHFRPMMPMCMPYYNSVFYGMGMFALGQATGNALFSMMGLGNNNNNIFYQQPMDSEEEGRDVTVAVEEGDSVYQIGRTLESRGLIQDAKVFVVQEKLSNYSGKLQPGTYILNTSMTPDEIMEILAKENVAGQPDQTQDGETEQAGSSELQEGSDASGEAEQGGAEE